MYAFESLGRSVVHLAAPCVLILLASCASPRSEARIEAKDADALAGLRWSKHPLKPFQPLATVPKSQAPEAVEEPAAPGPTGPGGIVPFATHINLDGPETFKGKSRKHAKTSLVNAEVEEMSLSDLISELKGTIPPGLVGSAGNPDPRKRVPEEKRNVQVQGWLHFYALEKDGDFHLIIGTSKNYAQGRRFTVEISGVNPDNPTSMAVLRDVRERFKEGVRDADNQDWPGSYVRIPATPVKITGALFFDTDHLSGVGPQGYKAATNWEIHPATDIEFGEPQ